MNSHRMPMPKPVARAPGLRGSWCVVLMDSPGVWFGAQYRRGAGVGKGLRDQRRPGDVGAGERAAEQESRAMAIRIAPLPEGARVEVVRGNLPQDPAALGRIGTVVAVSEYRYNQVGVLLDGEAAVRYFAPGELRVVAAPPPAPERELAKERKPLP
jgi:hypothetical protein